MNTELSVEENSVQEQIKLGDSVLGIVDRLDFLDIQILRKFYSTGKKFPYDTQPFCFPILYKEMKVTKQLKIGLEALRKRLDVLTGCGLLLKIHNSNPTTYSPINGKGEFVKAVITRFFLMNGLTQFL